MVATSTKRNNKIRTSKRIYELDMIFTKNATLSELLKMVKLIRYDILEEISGGINEIDWKNIPENKRKNEIDKVLNNEKKSALMPRRCRMAKGYYDKKCFESDLHCPTRLWFNTGITLGKSDLFVFTRTNHFYWSSICRMRFNHINNIIDVLGLPCIHVKLDDKHPVDEIDEIADIDNFRFKGRYIIFTLIRPRCEKKRFKYFGNTGKKNTAEKNAEPEKTPDVSIETINNIINYLQKVKTSFKKDMKMNAFLSFTSYRIIIKWEFDKLSDYYDVLMSFRRNMNVEDTSSIIGWNILGDLKQPLKDSFKDDRKIKKIIKDLEKTFMDKRLQEDDDLYFTILIGSEETVSEKKVMSNVKTIVDNINRNTPIPRYIFHEAGYWGASAFIKTNNPRKLLYNTTERLRKIPGIREVLTIPQWKSTGLRTIQDPPSIPVHLKDINIEENPLKKELWDFRCENLRGDPYYRQIYDIKSRFEWLLTRIHQLKGAWAAQKAFLPQTIIFDRIAYDIQLIINEVTEILKGGSSHDKNWSDLKEKLTAISRFCIYFDSVIAAYNERLEGLQIATISEPIVRVSERVGFLDLITLSLDKLMIDYCGRFKEKCADFLRYSNINSANPSLNNRLVTLEWNGITSSSFGRKENQVSDYLIIPKYNLLYVPIHLKLDAEHGLLPLSHECAHFIKYNVLYPQKVNNNPPKLQLQLEKIWMLYNSFRSELWALPSGRFVNIDNFDHDKNIEIFEESNHEYEKEISIYDSVSNELFTDIMAGCIGGPFYYLSLPHHCNAPGLLLPPSLRIKAGIHLGERMKWSKEWLKPLKDLLYRLNDSENEYQEYSYERFEIWLGNVLRDDFYPRRICEFLDKTFEISPLFFSFDDNDLQKVSSKKTFNLCLDIARQLGEDDLLVTDHSPRYIAAASILPGAIKDLSIGNIDGLDRPYYPSGRIYHSILYSQKRGPVYFRADKHQYKNSTNSVKKPPAFPIYS